MNYEIIEKNGKQYRKVKNGGLFLVAKANPLFAHLPSHAGIYCITCLLTKKKYIGQSTNVRARMYSHKGIKGVLSYLDINNVSIELLQDCKDLNETDRLKLEIELIIKHNSFEPHGFNKQHSPVGFSKSNRLPSLKKKKFWSDVNHTDHIINPSSIE